MSDQGCAPMSAHTPPRSRYEPAALVASLVSAAVALGLVWTILAGPWTRVLDQASWLSTALFGGAGLGVVLTWFGFAVLGMVLGFITLSLPGHRRRRAFAAVVVGALSLVAVPVMGLHEFLAWAGPHHPSDEELVAVFEQHQEEFAAVAAAVSADEQPDQADLRALGVGSDRLVAAGSGEFYLCVSAWGIVPSGSAKGYYYSATPPRPLVEDLDADAVGDGYTFRRVSGPWYLYFETW